MAKKKPPKQARESEVIDAEIVSEELEREIAPSEEGPRANSSSGVSISVDYDLPAVSPTDPLRQYINEIRQYPLLDPEEELELANRMIDEGDLDAAKKLVTANLRLVIKIAYEYANVYSNLMDLIQEGNVGLMKAVSKYDPTKGARVGYYASWWIRSYILKYLLDNFRLVKIGTTQAQKKLFYHLMKEKQRLEAQGILAAPKLLAEKLDVKEKEVVEMEHRLSGSGAEVSIDTPVPGKGDSDSNSSFGDLLPSVAESSDEILEHQQVIEILKESLPEFEETLDQREAEVLQKRLLSEKPATLQQLADKWELTRERVRQIESKLIGKLREFMSDRF